MALGAWRGRSGGGDRRRSASGCSSTRSPGALHWEAWRAGRGPPRAGPPRRARLVGDALPGRADGARARASTTSSARRSRCRRAHHRPHRGPAAVGRGQGAAPRARFAAEHDLDLDDSFAYSNGDEDIPFLEAAGHPVRVDPEPSLARAGRRARLAGPALRSRGRPPARSSVAPHRRLLRRAWRARGGGPGIGLLQPLAPQAMVDITGGVGSDLGAGAGRHRRARSRGSRAPVVGSAVRVRLQPPEQARPDRAHEAAARRVHRRGQEGGERNVPGFGQFFHAGRRRVRRPGATRRRRTAALEPAVDKLREEGLSLVIAPEGTRSATPRLGPFKKGAFHIAMQAGVPIVPDRAAQRRRADVARRRRRCARARSRSSVLPPGRHERTWRRRETLGRPRRRVSAERMFARARSKLAGRRPDSAAVERGPGADRARPVRVTVLRRRAPGARPSPRWRPQHRHAAVGARRRRRSPRRSTSSTRNTRYLEDRRSPERCARRATSRGRGGRRRARRRGAVARRSAACSRTPAPAPPRPGCRSCRSPRGSSRDPQAARREIIAEVLPGHPVGLLAGPNLAREVLDGYAAAAVVAMPDEHVARALQPLFAIAALPRLPQRRPARLRARRGAEEHHRDRRGHGRRPRRRRQHARAWSSPAAWRR